MKPSDMEQAKDRLNNSLEDLKSFAFYRGKTVHSVKDSKRSSVVLNKIQSHYFQMKEKILIVLRPHF